MPVTDKYPDLRPADLVAKGAHVSSKQTIRVLLAAQAICRQLNIPFNQLVYQAEEATRPTPQNVTACEQAYVDLRDGQYDLLAKIDKYR